MTRFDAIFEVQSFHGPHARAIRVSSRDKWRYLVGRNDVNGKFICEASGNTWEQALTALFIYHIKRTAQVEIPL